MIDASRNENDIANQQAILNKTIAWFTQAVLGLNLCPFAHAPARLKSIRWQLLPSAKPDDVLTVLKAELALLADTPHTALETTVLIAPRGFDHFDDYLDMLDFINAWLEESGHSEWLQLASFHPAYQFDGLAEDDRANWTNRSPYPLFHLIREHSITRALDAGANIEAITQRNIEVVRALSDEKMREIFPHYEG